MAIKRNKDESVKNHEIKVTRANEIESKNVIMFDMIVNDVQIYGCSYRTLTNHETNEEFAKIGFPSRKGNDDKWYNNAYVKLTPEDITEIEKQIEALI